MNLNAKGQKCMYTKTTKDNGTSITSGSIFTEVFRSVQKCANHKYNDNNSDENNKKVFAAIYAALDLVSKSAMPLLLWHWTVKG